MIEKLKKENLSTGDGHRYGEWDEIMPVSRNMEMIFEKINEIIETLNNNQTHIKNAGDILSDIISRLERLEK